MAKFFVGQRVRVARPFYRQNLGLEGVIAELFPEVQLENGAANCRVRWSRPAIGHCSHTEQLEPILPDGHRPGNYSLSELLDRCKAGEGIPA